MDENRGQSGSNDGGQKGRGGRKKRGGAYNKAGRAFLDACTLHRMLSRRGGDSSGKRDQGGMERGFD